MATFANRFPGKCASCGARVATGEGICTGPPWTTFCKAHVPAEVAAEANKPRSAPSGDAGGEAAVRVERYGDTDQLAVSPASFMGDRFEDFKAVAREAGASFDFEKKTNLVSATALLEVVSVFKKGKFKVILAPELQARLSAEADAARVAGAAADARILKIRDTLAKRGRRLWGFQEAGIAFLAERMPGSALLGDDMGLGKTVQTLLALPEGARVIVVCPKNVASNWVDECRAWRPDLRPMKVKTFGPRWADPGQVVVMTYEWLPETPPETPAPEGLIVVVDEAHRLKGTAAKVRRRERWENVRDAVLARKGTSIISLTGTPLVNELNEVWQVFEVGGLGTKFFGDKKSFKRLAANDPAAYERKVKAIMLRRKRDEVLKDLPEIVYQDVFVEIDATTRAKLDDTLQAIVAVAVTKKLEEERSKAVEAGEEWTDADEMEATERFTAEIDDAIELAFNGKLPIPFEMISRTKALLALGKAPASLDLLEDMAGESEPAPECVEGALWTQGKTFDDPIAFASAHIQPIEQILARRTGWTKITGETGADERGEIVKGFQAGRFAGIGLSIRAAGEGITLTKASRLIVNDPEWTPAAMDQLEGRFRRIGAKGVDRDGSGKKSILVVRMIADHILDRRIQELLDKKRGLAAQYVEVANVSAEHRATSVAAQIADALEGVTVATATSSFRPATTPEEKWTAGVLTTIAEGASMGDTRYSDFAVSLSRQYLKGAKLSPAQWTKAIEQAEVADPAGAPTRRPPQGDLEAWAARALLRLSGMDSDGARELNDMGFNKLDTVRGNFLASIVEGGLPPKVWAEAVRIARRYPRQVGAPPTSEVTK